MSLTEIQYRFDEQGCEEHYTLCFDESTFDLITTSAKEPSFLPEWTELSFCQCSNCPLSIQSVPHCPLAIELHKVMDTLGDNISYQEVYVEVITPNRNFNKFTTWQEGMSSMVGLIMSTCGCPHVDYFKPMAKYHLPFADTEETLVRSIQMFLLARFLEDESVNVTEISLDALGEIYHQIHHVNIGVARRLQSVVEQDSTVNAVVLLDMFSGQFRFNLDEALLKLENLYQPFLKG